MSSEQQEQASSSKLAITKVDECFMTAACMSANAGVILRHGGPFGASVVHNGMPVSCGHNTVLFDKDPTCHAEVNAIRHAVRDLGRSELSDCVLYTTCEPCPMCWGAIMASGLKVMYVGADRYCAARFGFDDKAFYDEFAGPASGTMMPVNPTKTDEDEKWMSKLASHSHVIVVSAAGELVGDSLSRGSDLGDALDTPMVRAIRMAAMTLGTHELSGCKVYASTQPDVFSHCACLWARISELFYAEPAADESEASYERQQLALKAEDRDLTTVWGCAVDECENVFKQWKSLSGQIY
ncbi:hypothetical protein FOL47_002450 [Perkinsus chesapeaki]|uniref:CMP/dCMP-type deaminase domain-containing protein n=1 Tax=Perkinsus chesapeaki TaxID=330153 RepID=A0A7J6MDD7_PERCH|nr:hypothetical protein FOL47_002450 [Perkinsus chesapeaki]